ncbi:hypothetical protein BKA69DRAFT_1127263 [Paraphysoderma sedebokerense]|nr:hypothetical protein BKA69DRAFT_1127263 [Paraphysoderma sedebokerense]
MHPSFILTAPTSTAPTSSYAPPQSPLAVLSPTFTPITPAPPLPTISTSFSKSAAALLSYERIPSPDPFKKIITAFPLIPPTSPTARKTPPPNFPPSPPPTTRNSIPKKHVIVGSSNGRILCLTPSDGYWNTIEVPLSSISADAEIISIDAFERVSTYSFSDVVRTSAPRSSTYSSVPSGSRISNLIVAVTTGQTTTTANGDKENLFALRIYGTMSTGASLEKKLFSLASDCQVIALPFSPLKLTHTIMVEGKRRHIAFLLCGSDGIVHMYLENPASRKFTETATSFYFPMLGTIDNTVTSVKIQTVGSKRIVIAGCEDGEFRVAVSNFNEDTGTFDTEHQIVYSFSFFSPITDVILFNDKANPNIISTDLSEESLHLLVALSVESSVVFRNILTDGLTNPIELTNSENYDCAMCAHVMDIDWDGENEIVLGTYGQMMVVYKLAPSKSSYTLMYTHRFAYPLYHFTSLDLNCDGVLELVVTSMWGVHVLQYDLEIVRERVEKGLERVKRLQEKKQRVAELRKKVELEREKRKNAEETKPEEEKIEDEDKENDGDDDNVTIDETMNPNETSDEPVRVNIANAEEDNDGLDEEEITEITENEGETE